jgi:hypothetical protein
MLEPLRSSSGRSHRRIFSVLGLVLFVLGTTAGAAFAYARTFGTGSASASTGSMAAVSIVAFTGGDAPTTSLLPGGSSDVVLRVSNPNAYGVTLTAISLNGTITAVGGIGTCTTTGVSTTFPSSPSIAAATGSHLIDLTGAASMSLASQSGCQGAVFHIPISANFQK